MKLQPYYYFMFLTLMAAIWHYRKYGRTYMALFIPYMAFIIGIELTTLYIKFVLDGKTGWIYNIVTPLENCFYAYIIYQFVGKPLYKKFIFYSITIFTIGVFCYLIFITGFDDFSPMIISTSSILMVIIACLLFYEYLNSEDYSIYRNWTAAIWLCVGVMIFYAGIAYCFALYDYILANQLKMFGEKLYVIIPRYLSIILYSCLTISLIVWKQKKSTSRYLK